MEEGREPTRLRAVLDVNVALSGLIATRGSSARTILEAWLYADAVEVVVSPLWLAEAADVFERDRLQRYVKGRAREWLAVIDNRAAHATDPEDRPWSVPGDPDDDYLIALAASVDAVLVTGDKAIPDAEPPPPIAIVTPREFVNMLDDMIDRLAAS